MTHNVQFGGAARQYTVRRRRTCGHLKPIDRVSSMTKLELPGREAKSMASSGDEDRAGLLEAAIDAQSLGNDEMSVRAK